MKQGRALRVKAGPAQQGPGLEIRPRPALAKATIADLLGLGDTRRALLYRPSGYAK